MLGNEKRECSIGEVKTVSMGVEKKGIEVKKTNIQRRMKFLKRPQR